jgi:ADP-dependent NAD(P)H-hydrate dehydratase / NAD(P)H-hydrate epimerase
MALLPDWCDPLFDSELMRSIDQWATGQMAIASLELMERAGMGLATVVETMALDGIVVVVCGKGNNAGDGLVLARLLRERARQVTVVCTYPKDELSEDARVNFERLPGAQPVSLTPEALHGAALIVDALLGTGFHGVPRGALGQAIEFINATSVPVVSVDVPSGVDASTGVVTGAAVKARTTATFHAAKAGLWIRPGKDYAGQVHRIDIGIPRGAPAEPKVGLIKEAVLAQLPKRTGSSTKFISGHVMVAGGSRGLTGAPRMAAHAAMRAGAGYVTAYVPASLQAIVATSGPPELMTKGLAEQDGDLTAAAVASVLQASERGGALALGPGLGRGDSAVAFARELAREAKVAMVLDADGLNAHAGRLADLASRKDQTVLTPHAGELGRLLELDSKQIEAERLHYVREAAQRSCAVVVLKGDDTLIADPDGRVAVSEGGSPALATAGTGDVLTGVISALLAHGLDAFTAASAGVCLHARAGRLAARRQGAAEGVIASDVIAALPTVRAMGGSV